MKINAIAALKKRNNFITKPAMNIHEAQRDNVANAYVQKMNILMLLDFCVKKVGLEWNREVKRCEDDRK